MGVLGRLYRGENNVNFIGNRKRWYLASAVLILVCLLSIGLRGFNFGIEFAGGSQFQLPKQSSVSLEDARSTVEDAGIEVASSQEAGSGAQASYVIRTAELNESQERKVRAALSEQFDVDAEDIAISQVSSSWGGDVTRKALIGLLVFLVVVAAYLWIRFERKMALAALLALLHDLALTAGVYSIIGFEVTPGTVVGMLTILGYSLYDTVVVFDKVDENTRGLLGGSRMTYGEAANLAVNQTLMRSINTSLIGLLPVAGLLFVGAGLLGVGTLKDLALVLFVGMLTGAYSSLFLATPWLVDLKRMEPRYSMHEQRVIAKRAGTAPVKPSKAAKGTSAPAADEPDDEDELEPTPAGATAGTRGAEALAGASPRPGARPPRKRTGGKGGGRPSGKRKR